MAKGHVAILVPMTVELSPVLSALPVRRSGGRRSATWVGEQDGRALSVHLVGIGPERARQATERVLGEHDPERIMVCGIAGGLAPGVRKGDLIVPSEVIDGSTGERYTCEPWSTLAPRGSLVTTNGIWSVERLDEHVRAGVSAVDMETAAAAEVAVRHGVAWSAVRGISDLLSEGIVDDSTLGLTRPDGTTDVAAALRHLATSPSRIAPLMRVAKDTRRATSAVARAVAAALRAAP